MRFSGDYIKDRWLSGLNIKVDKLKITNSNLKHVLYDAFNSDVFNTNLESLTIDNSLSIANNPHIFTLLPIRGLKALTTLVITNNPTLNIVDSSGLDSLKDSLTTLRITRIANTWSLNDLLASVMMKRLTLLDLTLNHFTSINGSMFTGVAETLKSLYLTNSKIETIAANTFDNFKTLQYISLQSNWLTNLPSGVFNHFLNSNFSVLLASNRWHCDCDLTELQSLVLDYPKAFTGTIKCASPAELNDVEVIAAELCSKQSVETTLTQSISVASSPGNSCDGNGNGTPKFCSTSTEATTEGKFSNCLATENIKKVLGINGTLICIYVNEYLKFSNILYD